MGITVLLPDGEEVDVETDDDTVARRTAARHYADKQRRAAPGYRAARSEAEKKSDLFSTRGLTGGFVDQVAANLGVSDELAGAGAYAGTALRNLFTDQDAYSPQDAYEAARDVEVNRTREYARNRPGMNALAAAAGVAVSGRPATGPTRAFVGPVNNAGRMVAQAPVRARPIAAGARVAAVNAPFAYARQEGTPMERLPGAALETAVTGVLGAGGQALSNSLASRVGPQAARLQQFDDAGVRPTAAAVGGRDTAPITKAVAENPVAGWRARANLQNSLDDTSAAAARIADEYGTPGPADLMGQRIQEGVERFSNGPALQQFGGGVVQRFDAAIRAPTRDVGSFSAKANAVYEPIWDRLNNILSQRAARQIRTPTSTRFTRQAIAGINNRVQNPALSDLTRSPLINRITTAVDEAGTGIPLSDLRQLRTWVRRAQSDPQLRQDADQGALQLIEGALTQDIYRSVAAISPDSVRQLRLADTFYRKGTQRIQDALQSFASSNSGEDAYRRVLSAASNGAGADLRKLTSLKLALSPDEWGDISATVISNLGRPTSGAANALENGAFSVNTFVTNYAKLSNRGRRVLFGDMGGGGARARELHAALENLAQVAGMQKAVQGAANHSNTAVAGQSVALLGGLGASVVNPSLAPSLLGSLGAMTITGEALTNPRFVRWLASAPAAGQTVGGLRRHAAALAQLAANNPALQPIYADFVRSLEPETPADTQAENGVEE
jgi:hypothetical protein